MDYRLFRNSSVFFSIQTLLTIIHSQQVVPQTYNSWIVFPSENSVHDSLSSCKIGLWRPKVVLVHSAPKKSASKGNIFRKENFQTEQLWSEVACAKYLIQQISKFLEHSMDIFYVIRPLKSIDYSKNHWF